MELNHAITQTESRAKPGQGSSGQTATTAMIRAALLLAAGLGLLSVRQAFVAQAGVCLPLLPSVSCL